jgi:hypothetical protein
VRFDFFSNESGSEVRTISRGADSNYGNYKDPLSSLRKST